MHEIKVINFRTNILDQQTNGPTEQQIGLRASKQGKGSVLLSHFKYQLFCTITTALRN